MARIAAQVQAGQSLAELGFTKRPAVKGFFVKSAAMKLGQDLRKMGFKLFATAGTAAFLQRGHLPVTAVPKAYQSGHTTIDMIAAGEIDLIINTPLGQQARSDQNVMYGTAVRHNVPLITTLSAAQAVVNGVRALRESKLKVKSLQVHYRA